MSLPGIRQKPRVGAFVCLRPQGRAGDLFVIKKAMNLGLGFVCGGCDPRRMAQAQAGACLQLRPQGRAGDFGCVQYGYTASRARCVWLLCGYVVGGASYSFGEVQERAAQLFRFGGGEAPGAAVAVDTVEFVVEPGG